MDDVPVRWSVMQAMQNEADEANKKRLAMLETVITKHILIPPKFARYPEVEEVLWRTVQGAIVGKIAVDVALRHMRDQVEHIIREGNGRFPRGNGLRKSAPLETRSA